MNYYETLGVSQTASLDEIKTSYRKLALQFHPDRNQGSKDCEEKFKKIVEAYNTLGDISKKDDYDLRRNSNFPKNQRNNESNFSNVRSGFGKRDTSNIHFRDHQKDFENYWNNFDIRRKSVNEDISKNIAIYKPQKWKSCAGSHILITFNLTLEQIARGFQKEIEIEKYVKCEHCNGTGCDDNFIFDCEKCIGEGKILKETKVKINWPKGNFNPIRRKNDGDFGSKGTSSGDLIIKVEEIRSNKFQRFNLDVFSEKKISVQESLMGKDIIIETLYGNEKLFVPPGTKTNEIFIIKGKGLKGTNKRGDHLVEIKIDPYKKNLKKKHKDTDLMGILANNISNNFQKKLRF